MLCITIIANMLPSKVIEFTNSLPNTLIIPENIVLLSIFPFVNSVKHLRNYCSNYF